MISIVVTKLLPSLAPVELTITITLNWFHNNQVVKIEIIMISDQCKLLAFDEF